jgi:DNA-binding NtrC family response regulator
LEIESRATAIVHSRELPHTERTSLLRSFTGIGRRRRILVIEDNIAIGSVLSRALSRAGYEVSHAEDSSEGLNLFSNSPFDLVITDLHMPRMDGWTLASHIKKYSPHTPILLITGQGKDAILEKIKGSSVDFAILKPFTLEEIRKTVHRMLNNTLSKEIVRMKQS